MQCDHKLSSKCSKTSLYGSFKQDYNKFYYNYTLVISLSIQSTCTCTYYVLAWMRICKYMYELIFRYCRSLPGKCPGADICHTNEKRPLPGKRPDRTHVASYGKHPGMPASHACQKMSGSLTQAAIRSYTIESRRGRGIGNAHRLATLKSLNLCSIRDTVR